MIRLRPLDAEAVPLDAVRRRVSSSLAGSRTLHTAFWSLADQSVVSALNFVTMLLLARELAPREFGQFVLVYTSLLFSNSLQSSLVTQPHNVIGTSKTGDDYATYTSSTAVGQAGLSLVLAFCVALGAAIAFTLHAHFALLLLLLSPTVFAWQAQEFFRRVLYTEGRSRGALANDFVSYGGQAFVTIVLWRAGLLTEKTAVVAIAVTSAVAALYGLWQLRSHLVWRFESHYLRENWEFGRWLTGANLTSWISAQSYRFIVALLLGTAATAQLAVGDLCMRPLGVLITSLESILPTRFARVLARGTSTVSPEVRTVLAVTGPLVIVYAVLVAGFGHQVVHAIYGSKYGDMHLLLILFPIAYSLYYFNIVIGSALRAQRATRVFFVGTACTAVVSLTLGWFYIKLFGIEGALISSIVNWTVFTTVILRWSGRHGQAVL